MRHFQDQSGTVHGYDDTQADLITEALSAGWTELVTWPIPVAASVPHTVSMRQARLALFNAGLLESVNATIAAMAGAAGDAARIEWEFAATVQRASPLVSDLSAALGLTSPQLDSLFTAAIDL